MILIYLIFVKLLTVVNGNPVTDDYKDQYCTDPRTMQKHAAYSEWADAYSCTRHRCQPGGRNLAIYTVGCKRVEAPESAIECEEVVEDTNIQFPYCCTRLRCLVVVRGEVWTRVLGQPWETLPAAPWSHMYKMKKPPPTGGTPFAQKGVAEGPVYELGSETQPEKVLRSTKISKEEPCKDLKLRASASPDIVIALSTKDEVKKERNNETGRKKKKMRKSSSSTDEYVKLPQTKFDTVEDTQDTHYDANDKPEKNEGTTWTEIPQSQWSEPELLNEMDLKTHNENAEADLSGDEEKAVAGVGEKDKSNNLQALVDAIGSRMRDIENVVQKMSEKVQQTKPTDEVSGEKKSALESTREHLQKMLGKPKKSDPNANTDKYKRFKSQTRSKYVHVTVDAKTEQPLFVEDPHLSGFSYFSDASNNVVRRADSSKEPQLTYMAPVDTSGRRSAADTTDGRKKHKHTHKKKHKKSHKKHQHKDEKRKAKARTNSLEANRGVVSLEDSSAAVK